ncbi:MAG: AmmeMemoRadiSam system protein A, partial [Spirochaetaceae bacterium]
MDFNLTNEEKEILLKTARLCIEARLNKNKPAFPDPTPLLLEKCGAFVSLHIDCQLRGCIGFIIAVEPLVNTVREMAQAAAFSDPRFPPVNLQELPRIEIEISVLSPLQRVSDVSEIIVGKHGLMVERGGYSGLLLPQVATEYGWDRATFLAHTCNKAGLAGDAWQLSGTVIKMFSAVVFNEGE